MLRFFILLVTILIPCNELFASMVHKCDEVKICIKCGDELLASTHLSFSQVKLDKDLSVDNKTVKRFFKNASGPNSSRVSMSDIGRKHISFDDDLKSVLFYKNMFCIGIKRKPQHNMDMGRNAYSITVWELKDGTYSELSTKYIVLGADDPHAYGDHCIRVPSKYIPRNHPHQGRSVVVDAKYVVLSLSKSKSVYWSSIMY